MSGIIINPYAVIPAGPPPAERVRQGFESGVQPAGWTATGIDFAYATSPAPLVGSFSLAGSSSGSAAGKTFPSISGNAYGYFIYASSLGAAASGILEIYAGAVRQLRVRALSSGAIRVYQSDGSTTAGTSAALLTANTPAHIWWRYLKGTGADGQFDLWVSANATKPGSTSLSLTNLNASDNAGEVRFPVTIAGTTCIWDNILVSTEEYGSNPF